MAAYQWVKKSVMYVITPFVLILLIYGLGHTKKILTMLLLRGEWLLEIGTMPARILAMVKEVKILKPKSLKQMYKSSVT